MPEDNQMTGTPAQDDGNAAAQAAMAGTPAKDGGDAGESADQELKRLREERKQWLQWKSGAEEANRLRDQLQQMQATQSAPPPTNGYVEQQQQAEWQRLQDSMQKAQIAAANGDYVAELALATLRQQAAAQQQLMLEQQLSQVPEAARQAVRAELQTGRYADAQAAYMAVVGRYLWQRQSEMQAKERELEEVAAKRAQGVVGTGRPVPVTANEMRQSSYSYQQFIEEHDKLSREDPVKARDFAARFNRGELNFSGG